MGLKKLFNEYRCSCGYEGRIKYQPAEYEVDDEGKKIRNKITLEKRKIGNGFYYCPRCKARGEKITAFKPTLTIKDKLKKDDPIRYMRDIRKENKNA